MAVSRTQALTDAYLGADLAISPGTNRIEIGLLDGGALVAGTVRITSQGGVATEWPVAAANIYVLEYGQPRQPKFITFNVKAATGTPTAQILEV